MKTKADYTLNFKEYREITVPKGTKVSHNTAMGVDKNYHFVDEYQWIYENYPNYANILKDDVFTYGINVPKEFIDYEKPKETQKKPKRTQKTQWVLLQ